jgi:hypothetical protein
MRKIKFKPITKLSRILQVSIVIVYGLAGLAMAVEMKSPWWGYLVWILFGIFIGFFASVAYIHEEKIFWGWTIAGLCSGLILFFVGGQKQELIPFPILFAFTASFIGVRRNQKNILIGALIGAIIFGGLALLTTKSTLGNLVIENKFLELAIGLMLGAWSGALFSRFIY